MGLKNKATSKGVISENTSGDGSFVINTRYRGGTQNFSETSGTVSLALTGSKPINVFEASAGDITVELPTVSAGNVGLEYTMINADVTNDLILSASTGQHIDSGPLTFTVAEEAATIMATSSSLDGFGWFVVFTKA